MKKTTLILAIIFYSFLSFGQDRKNNTIIIESTDTAIDLLLEYAKHLQDEGYTIDRIDKDLMTLSTDFKSYKPGGGAMAVVKIDAFIRERDGISRMEVKGNIEISSIYGKFPMAACMCGLPGDAQKDGFKEVVKTLNGYELKFLTK